MHSIFSLVQRYLLSRAGSSVIGLFVVISLVWFAGPTLGLTSVTYRIAAIGGIVAVALSVWLIRRYIASRRGEKLQEEISGQGDSGSASKKQDIQLLKEKMNEAISSLKSSELGAKYRGNAALYALPWYMIIGPSAAGKSTLLRQSGLHFPYSSEDDIHIKGYGGTRNCDWWFSDQAVFLDTAGRYTTEDDDRDEWIAFLGMIRKHRKKMPINGVLVAVSLAELLTADSEGLEWHVKVIRNRIRELIQELGLVFPVYLVFTKSDLLSGFESFFEDLSEQERNQVWGSYLYDKQKEGDDVSEVFEHNLNNLYGRLCDMRLRKVSMQRNLKRKADLFDFPSQFGAAAEKLNEFINLLFKDNPYQETPQFAGVYFTCATQEGTPIERVIGNLRQAFGFAKNNSDEVSHSQRPFFIKNLFTEVIFQIQGGARANRKRLTWDKGLRTAAVLLSLIIIGSTYLLLSGSYATNVYLLNQGASLSKEVADNVKNESLSIKQRYKAVLDLYLHLESLHLIDQEIPWIKQAAFYRANEQEIDVNKIVEKSLYYAYWIPVTQAIENKVDNFSQRWSVSSDSVREELRPEYYQSLKLYLQMTRKEYFNLEVTLKETRDIWANLIFNEKSPAKKDLKYIELLTSLFLSSKQDDVDMLLHSNEELVKKARDNLYTKPDPDQLYALLLNRGKTDWENRSLNYYVKGEGSNYITSNKSIPGIYSADAWYEFVKPEIESLAQAFAYGDWVMGDKKVNNPKETDNSGRLSVIESPDSEQELKGLALSAYLNKEIRVLYFQDYVDNWIGFLRSIKYKLPRSLSDKSMALMHLSSSDGPIGQISKTIAKNTLLYESRPVEGVNDEENKEDGEKSEAYTEKLKRVVEIDAAFSDLQKFTVPKGKSTVSDQVNGYLEALSKVYGEVDGLAASVDIKRDSEKFASELLSGSGVNPSLSKAWTVTTSLINSVKQPTRPILKSLLSPPISMAWSGVVGQATSGLQQEWNSEVVRPYKRKIAGKFPFSLAGDDAALADVDEFYHPKDGILWKFVNERLEPYLRKTSRGWVTRRWLGVGANFSYQFLQGLDKAQKITEALYTKRDGEPNITFYLQPDPTSNLREMQIESNGQTYRYRNGPQMWQRFDWPGEMNQIGARVMGVADHGKAVGELRADGPWGLFHLLTLADIEQESNTHFKTSWDLPSSGGGTVHVSFNLRSDRQDNMFDFKLINSFKLPKAIFRNRQPSRLAAY